MFMIPRRDDFDLFNEMFRAPFFAGEDSKLMKTDIKETEDKYLIDIDLPGYDKENIKIEVENGYLIIHAKTSSNKEEKEEGKFVRKERYIGECSRSFYIGENTEIEDIKASFKNGTLKLEVVKKEQKPELPEKRYIEIED